MQLTAERRAMAIGDSDDFASRWAELHREVSSFTVEREVGLLGDLSLAIGSAPDVDRGLAVLTLAEGRQSQLDRLRFAGGGDLAPLYEDDRETDWVSLVLDMTVGARLGAVFFTALQDLLKDEHILALEVVVRHEPSASQILWDDALAHQDLMPAAVFRVVSACTQALQARPAVQSRIGHDGTLSLFASTMDALPAIFKPPGAATS